MSQPREPLQPSEQASLSAGSSPWWVWASPLLSLVMWSLRAVPGRAERSSGSLEVDVQGLDRRELEEVVLNAHRLLFQLTADGHLDAREREQLLASIALDLAERVTQGKSAATIAGELGTKLLGVVSDVLTTDVDELENRLLRAQADNDLTRAARLRARIERKSDKQREQPAPRPVRRQPAPLPPSFDALGVSPLPPRSEPIPAAAPPPDMPEVDLEVVPYTPPPSVPPPEEPPSVHFVMEVDPVTGEKRRALPNPFGAPAKR